MQEGVWFFGMQKKFNLYREEGGKRLEKAIV